jgi:hypothetical protein
MTNIFIPTALPLLSSYSLTLTSIEYGNAYRLLSQSPLADSHEIRRQLEDALRYLEQELIARGHARFALIPGSNAHEEELVNRTISRTKVYGRLSS